MIRRTISLILVLALASVVLAASVQAVFAGPQNGDVDPTGLDSTRRVRSIDRTPTTIVEAQQDVVSARALVTRWMETFYLKTLLRSLGF